MVTIFLIASSMGNKRLLAYGALYGLWGASYLAIHCVVTVLPPLLAAGFRYTVAGLLLSALCDWKIRGQWPSRGQVRNAVLSGIVLFGCIYAAVFWAETRLSSWLVSALYATSFLWAYLTECILQRSAPGRSLIAALLAGLVAVPLLLVPGTTTRGTLLRALVVLLSAMLWASSLPLLRRIDLPNNYRQTAALQLAGAGPFLIALSWLCGELKRIAPNALLFTWKPMAAMTYLILGSSVIAFSAFHWLIRNDRPYMVASAAYINPLVALALGVLLTHERCTPIQACGAAVLLGSVCAVWLLRQEGFLQAWQIRQRLRYSRPKVPGSNLVPLP